MRNLGLCGAGQPIGYGFDFDVFVFLDDHAYSLRAYLFSRVYVTQGTVS